MTGKGSILVVDDSVESLQLLTEILVGEGYQVRPADSGALALASVAAAPPALILLDIHMPGLHGFEVCRRLKASEESRRIPVMFLSASTEAKERVEGLRLGAADFISKPFQREELLARVQTHLELHWLNAKLEQQVEERTAALQRSQALLQQVVDGTQDAIFVKDLEGRFLLVNSGLCHAMGTTKEEVIGKDVRALFSPDDALWLMEKDRRVMAAEAPQTDEEVLTIKGNQRVFLATEGPVYDARGRVAGVFGVIRDVTERKLAEEALRRANAYNRSLLEASLDPLVTISPEGKIMDVNQATETATGYPREELIDTDFCDYFAEPETARRGYQRAFHDGLVRDYPMELRHRDGRVISVLYNASVYRDEAGTVIGVFAAARDLTERKRLEQELIRIQRLRAVGELSAGVCHNLNNLLTGVLTPADLLRMTSNDAKTQRLADMILEAGTRAAELVHRLHLSVRGTNAETLLPLALNKIIDGVVEMTRPKWKDEPEAKGLAIEVYTELAAAPTIKGTPSELNDLLINLLFNAVDAMPEGGRISIRTTLEEQFVRLDFTDTGIGMDEETRLRVFEPFFTTKMDVGSGLGLSTLHNSVTHWGGTVAVASAPGKGATFNLRLPLWQEEIQVPPSPSPALAARTGRILVIEDDPVVGGVLKEVLGAYHQVELFTEGQQALEQFAAGRYDVAILDLGMPGISGDQLARRIQAIDPAVARILFSGWVLEADDPRRALFDLVLQKPLRDLVAFEEAVAQALILRDQRTQ
ncbi:MAG: PAS domain S-box protein [Candidatus Latescibacteria bacterium]|nr:PAS domain S-box protein [Candidatus Latescibacterota bacterium]